MPWPNFSDFLCRESKKFENHWYYWISAEKIQNFTLSVLLKPSNKFQSNPVTSQNFQLFVFLSVSHLQGFVCFDKYFVVKSHSRVLKFLVEFNEVCKTGFESKIRTPWAEILAFFWDKVHRNSIFSTTENFKTRIYWKFGLFWKACIVTFQKSNIYPNKLLETSKLFLQKIV